MSKKEQWTFLQKFSSLLEASLPVEDAMHIASKNIRHAKFKLHITHMIAEAAEGRSLKEVFERHRTLWGNATISLVSAGEVSGLLAANLERAARGMKSRYEQKSKMISSLFYPAIISFLALGIVIFLLAFVYPKIIPLFTGMKTELPISTRMLIKVSSLIGSFWLYGIIALILSVLSSAYAIFEFERARLVFEKILLSTPIIGDIILLGQLSQVAFITGSLCQGGMTISDAIEMGGKSSSFKIIRNIFTDLHLKVNSGVPLSECVEGIMIFPPIWGDLIVVGEKTGSLPSMLINISHMHNEDIDERVGLLNKLVEPLMMIFVGLVVGFIALSIVTPMYSLTQHVNR